MQDFIIWCNSNQGFLSAVLSIMTILISVLTITLTYKIGKMPYKKEVSITPFLEKNGDVYFMNVLIVNCGFAPILMDCVRITNNKGLVIGMSDNTKPKLLNPNESIEINIKIFDNEENIAKHEVDFNNQIKIILFEHSGKKYVKRNGFPAG